ncbi:MAG: thermonuclease family protein [Phycisphaerales bacterium]
MLLWLVLIVALIIIDQRGGLLVKGSNDYQVYHDQQVRVVRVVDGDTIDVEIPDAVQGSSITRIRLWGVDAPEMRNDQGTRDAWAEESRDFVLQHAGGAVVTLRLERQRLRGSYGRVLAHVDLEDGSTLNRLLLTAGLARAEERWPHSRLLSYEQAELAARRARRGIWSE